jgi:hypothetical protein
MSVVPADAWFSCRMLPLNGSDSRRHAMDSLGDRN